MLQKFIEATVVGRTDHTPTLFSLQFEAPLDGFVAGQYCRVGLHMRTDKGDEAREETTQVWDHVKSLRRKVASLN